MATNKHRCLSAGILFADVGCVPISHCPKPGELVQTEGVMLTLGGCASNVALNLSRLEVPTGLCGSVGDDSFSDFVVRSLDAPFIDVSGLGRVKNACQDLANHQCYRRRPPICQHDRRERIVLDTRYPQGVGRRGRVLYLGVSDDAGTRKAGNGRFCANSKTMAERRFLTWYFTANVHIGMSLSRSCPMSTTSCGATTRGGGLPEKQIQSNRRKFFWMPGPKRRSSPAARPGRFSIPIPISSIPVSLKPILSAEPVPAMPSRAGFVHGLLVGDEPYTDEPCRAQGMSAVRHVSATRSVFTKPSRGVLGRKPIGIPDALNRTVF